MSAPEAIELDIVAAKPVGCVLGTRDAGPLEFWVAVEDGCLLQLDDLLVVRSWKPDCRHEDRTEENADLHAVKFYGVVDAVRKLQEGVSFDSDTKLAMDGTLPVNVSYAAHVLVTRVEPEHFFPPQPGDAVFFATGDELKRALYQDRMKDTVPAGVMRNGQPALLNYAFLNGENGAHVNISGVSGVATKTSFALFLLHSLFESQASVDPPRAVIFNVKGEDLLFLDQENNRFAEKEAAACGARGFTDNRYALCGLPAAPFPSVRFAVPPRKEAGVVVPSASERVSGTECYAWTVRDFCLRGLLPYCFSERDVSLVMGFLVEDVAERLRKLAEADDGPWTAGLRVRDWESGKDAPRGAFGFDELGVETIASFEGLAYFIEDKLAGGEDGTGDPRWVGRHQAGTVMAFVRRLRAAVKHLAPLVRGDLTEEQAVRFQPDPLVHPALLSVVDINALNAQAQMFVVGVTLKTIFERKERNEVGKRTRVFVVLDELNQYAPRDAESPIKEVLLDIAERGRSLGIVLVGAQQTASEVERRVVANASIRVVGRLDPAEAEHPEYRFLPATFRQRAAILQPGTMIVSQPEVPSPVLVTFPFPAWATRKDEAGRDLTPAEESEEAERWLQ
ncbi:MAG TPA: ATP-binding protein [Deinococcales bacterium]|nr:ATP-binding protein [Deinococcales bacterium]